MSDDEEEEDVEVTPAAAITCAATNYLDADGNLRLEFVRDDAGYAMAENDDGERCANTTVGLVSKMDLYREVVCKFVVPSLRSKGDSEDRTTWFQRFKKVGDEFLKAIYDTRLNVTAPEMDPDISDVLAEALPGTNFLTPEGRVDASRFTDVLLEKRRQAGKKEAQSAYLMPGKVGRKALYEEALFKFVIPYLRAKALPQSIRHSWYVKFKYIAEDFRVLCERFNPAFEKPDPKAENDDIGKVLSKHVKEHHFRYDEINILDESRRREIVKINYKPGYVLSGPAWTTTPRLPVKFLIAVEKDAMYHAIGIFCGRLVSVMSAKGQMALSGMEDILKKLGQDGDFHLVLLAVTDHDSAGMSIANTLANHMRIYIPNNRLTVERLPWELDPRVVPYWDKDNYEMAGKPSALWKASLAARPSWALSRAPNRGCEIDVIPSEILVDVVKARLSEYGLTGEADAERRVDELVDTRLPLETREAASTASYAFPLLEKYRKWADTAERHLDKWKELYEKSGKYVEDLRRVEDRFRASVDMKKAGAEIEDAWTKEKKLGMPYISQVNAGRLETVARAPETGVAVPVEETPELDDDALKEDLIRKADEVDETFDYDDWKS
ncbi:MAG: hypothetical protein M0R66_07615 [Candidatus Omnitrophica bacterium]|nr:hypothetical protein [Candidatus Omnitrophota bacterium]